MGRVVSPSRTNGGKRKDDRERSLVDRYVAVPLPFRAAAKTNAQHERRFRGGVVYLRYRITLDA